MFANRKFRFAVLAVICYSLVFATIDGFFPGMILFDWVIAPSVWLMTLALLLWAARLRRNGSDSNDPPTAK